MKRALLILLLQGCAVGAPPGFGEGKKWSAPIVNPLDQGTFLIPVRLKGQGPYLFSVDMDSRFSSIERSLVGELDLRTAIGGELPDERDKMINVFLAEVPMVQVGNLSVRNMRLQVHADRTFWDMGRPIRGVLGRDILADSLIYQLNRDEGYLTIATQGNLPEPANGTRISYAEEFGDFYGQLAPRRLIRANINGAWAKMHFDPGSNLSTLRSKNATRLGATPVKASGVLIDDLGSSQPIQSAANMATVSLAGIEFTDVLMVNYPDKRFEEDQVPGTIGQNILHIFSIWLNPHKEQIVLTPMSPTGVPTVRRLERWGGIFLDCQKLGCVDFQIEGSQDAPVLKVSRTEKAPTKAFQVVLGQSNGQAPLLYATLPEGFSSVSWPISPIYQSDLLTVLDASLYPPACQKTALDDNRCIFQGK